jgi:murein L,D-transpeptidase YcbB/YkuD
MSRSPRLSRAALTAAILALAACGSSAPRPPATPAPSEPGPAAAAAPPRPWLEDEVRGADLIARDAVAAFYAARGERLAWTRAGAIEEVLAAIDGIAADGLDPDDYHRRAIAKLLEERAREPSPERDAELDTLVTDAVAALVDHVRYGKVQPVELDPTWNVDPRKGARPLHDRIAAVAAATSPRAEIDEAKPRHFIYRGLVEALAELRRIDAAGGWPKVSRGKPIRPGGRDGRLAAVRARLGVVASAPRHDPALVRAVKAFQTGHRLPATGVIDNATIAEMNVSAADRADQVRANLERARWVLDDLDADFILVNLPAYKAYLIRDGKKVFETRTMIGKEARRSPTFRATLEAIVFNPEWNVPPTILAEDVIAKLRAGDDVLSTKHLEVVGTDGRRVDPATIDWGDADADDFPYRVRQPPGPDNVLGAVKFEFPNPHAIYMHDTPSKELFAAADRAQSSGCIRAERPLDLAARLLGWPAKKIRATIAKGETVRVELDDPIPVLIVYWTVSVGTGGAGEVRYARDVYDLDGPLLAALERDPVRIAAR